MQSTREIALRTLCQIEYEGAYPNLALDAALTESGLDERDRSFVSELVYGTLRYLITEDYVIRHYSSIRLKKIAPKILMLLRLAVYQLLLMKSPSHAVCFETVELAKRIGHSGSVRFVNAIVRRIAKDGMPSLPKEQVEALSVQYSFPRWLVEKFIADFGEDAVGPLLASFQKVPPLSVRFNRLKTTSQELKQLLQEQGIGVTDGLYSDLALCLTRTGGVSHLEAYKDGLFTVQDEAAMLVATVLDPRQGERIWDVCAAPGGKTTQIAELCNNDAEILATDVHAHKIDLIQSACKRLGITCVNAMQNDATADCKKLGTFDRVLVDAPCSGLGILKRKTDIRHIRTMEDLKALTEIQSAILNNVCSAVKDGGVLVYSTCTINPDENEGVVNSFLKSHPEFVLEDVNQTLPASVRSKEKCLTLLPHIYDCDGFFIARMKKVNV